MRTELYRPKSYNKERNNDIRELNSKVDYLIRIINNTLKRMEGRQ